jgi:hypothetical protein
MAEEVEKRVHHVVRSIAKEMPQSGSVLAEEVNLYLSEWFAKGYELFSTHYLGENPEAYIMLYVLVRKGKVKASAPVE